jgi:mannosyltransferase
VNSNVRSAESDSARAVAALAKVRVDPGVALGLSIVVLALAVRVDNLGTKSLWLDEYYTFRATQDSLAWIWTDLTYDHVPGYFVLMWVSTHVIGSSEWALRLPSALAGTCAVFGVWLIGQEVQRPRAGLLAALLLGVSPFAVYWSQEAKPEALSMAIAVWSSFLLLAAWRRGGLGWWLGAWVLSLLGIYTFYYHFVILASQGLALLVLWLRRGTSWSLVAWLAGQVLLLVVFAPWLVSHLDKLQRNLVLVQQTGSVMPHYTSIVDYLGLSGRSVLGGEPFGESALAPTVAMTVTALAISAGLVVELHRPGPKSGLALISAWGVGTLVLGYVIQVYEVPYFNTRYLLAAAPAFLLVLSFACESLLQLGLAGAVATACVVAVVGAGWGSTIAQIYAGRPYEHPDYREAAAYFLGKRQAADILVADPGWNVGTFRYYLSSAASPLGFDSPEQAAAYVRNGLSSHMISGVWVAVEDGLPDQVAPMVASFTEAAGPEMNFKGLSLRYYRQQASGGT